MNRDVIPWNMTPILFCNGAARCGWGPHKFLRSDRFGHGSARQMFECLRCRTERVFGVVDLNQCGGGKEEN